MTICTHTADCGVIGEQDLTISYKHCPGRSGRGIEPDESESASIYWIKIGGVNGVEVVLSDDYITGEIIPACVADWRGEDEYAQERYAENLREERLAA